MRRLRHDDGAVAVLVAILLPLILIGIGALVLDVGSWYAERRQLQNGADAAALAIAQTCDSTGSCSGAATDAQNFVDKNSNDGASSVQGICGSAPGLTACLTAPANVPDGAYYVRVTSQTGTSAGPDLLPPVFGKVLDSSYNGKTVHATATAAYGRIVAASALPLAISTCEYDRLRTSGGGVTFHDGNSQDSCSASNSNLDAPGAFGWADTQNGECAAMFSVDANFSTSTGTAIPRECVALFDNRNQTASGPMAGTHQLIPIYDTVTGTGNNVVYHLIGFAEFIVEGWNFTGQAYWPPTPPCRGDVTCISGHFVKFVHIGDVQLGSSGQDFGATGIQLID